MDGMEDGGVHWGDRNGKSMGKWGIRRATVGWKNKSLARYVSVLRG